MKKLVFGFIFLHLIGQLAAQDKLISVKDGLRNWALYPASVNGMAWQNGHTASYLSERYDEIKTIDLSNGNESTVVTLDEINAVFSNANIDELSHLGGYEWYDANQLLLSSGDYTVLYNVKDKKLSLDLMTNPSAANNDFCKKNNTIAYTVANNLYLADMAVAAKQITSDSDTGWVSGQSVSRNEMGIVKGTFWSPDGKMLAFYRKDESRVGQYPLVDVTTPIATVNMIRYPMAGTESEEVFLGLYNLTTEKTTYIRPQEFGREEYLTCISWSPDSKFVYIAVVNRGQDHVKLNKYDAATGAFVKTLFEEKHSRYVEPEHDLLFLKSNPDQFIWQSERDGYNHLYLYKTDGTLVKQLTKGNWAVTEILGFDDKGENLFYMSTQESPIESHAYKLQLSNSKITKLTDKAGTHRCTLSPDGSYLIDSWSNTETPKVVDIIDAKGKVVKNLLTANNPLEGYSLGEMSIFTIKSTDKTTDLYCRMFKPANFDPTKKYPVVVYVYGGPHVQLITNSWLGGANLWYQHMAEKGYIMFTVDNRGSDNRGFEFESCIHRQMGQLEMQDQMAGIDYLKGLNYVDADRIGVHGWSYGGYMTTSLMTSHPDVYKVGVAGGPVIDWKYYEIMYGERYMDSPQDNPDGYAMTSLLDKADQLSGRLLIIHGDIDPTVVWQHSMDFVKSCVSAGVPVDYFVYPQHEHNVRGADRVHLMEKVTQYFDDHL